MATMNISLPDKLKAFVEERVAEGSYANVSDYVRDVLRKQQEAQNYQAYLRESIDAGLKSPVSDYSRADLLKKMQGAVK